MKEKIEQLEKELAELKAEFEKSQQPEKWQDKLVQSKSDGYYYITSNPNNGLLVNHSHGSSDRKPEHAFREKEHAELIKEKMLLMQEMYAFAHVKNEGREPDWNSGSQVKWGVLVGIGGVPLIESYSFYNYFVFGIVVKSEEIAKEMLEIFGERIKKYYSKQY